MEEISTLVRSGAFIPQDTKFISPTFSIPKRDGGTRLIHDLRNINAALTPPKFTLRGAGDAASVTRDSQWLVVLDLKHGYQQIAVDVKARKYLGALWGDKTVVSTVLPFGLNVSPYIFTRVTEWLARQVRKRFGLNVAVYVDDFLIGAGSEEELVIGIQKVRDFFGKLGVLISEKTSQLPSREVEFLGFLWNAEKKMISVTKERCKEYRRRVANLLRHPQSPQTWRKIVGKLLFLRDAVGATLRHVRSIMTALKEGKRQRLIEASGEARDDLLWWKETLRFPPHISLELKPVSAVITTDASDVMLGGVLEMIDVGSDQQTSANGKEMTSVPSRDAQQHINTKEVEALLEVISTNQQKLADKNIIWYTDNRTARAAIAKEGTQKLGPQTWSITKEVLDLASSLRIKILPKWVPGRLNGGADMLSRPSEWRSEWEQALSEVALKWGPWQEDPLGFTGDPTAVFESLVWADKRSLLVPKPTNIGSVLDLVSLALRKPAPVGPPSMWEGMTVVITPLWKGARWWPLLKTMRVDYIPLGRLETPMLRNWQSRNGHPAAWTASLIATQMPYGHREQDLHMSEHSEASSPGSSKIKEKERRDH